MQKAEVHGEIARCQKRQTTKEEAAAEEYKIRCAFIELVNR